MSIFRALMPLYVFTYLYLYNGQHFVSSRLGAP